MAHIETNKRSELNVKQDDMLASKRYLIERKPEIPFFYELEAAIVLDVVMEEDPDRKVEVLDWPVDANGKPAEKDQPNYGWIGMIRFRFVNSQVSDNKETLSWAMPMENTGLTEYPLMNEVVIVGKYLNNYYYSRKLNIKSLINANASFELERVYGRVDENLNDEGEKYSDVTSVMNGGSKDREQNKNHVGVLGKYFKFNPAIRAIKRYEGDTIIESRFGSSVRFGAYDDNRNNDNGEGEYSENGGNPMVLIRNRQEPVRGKTELPKLVNKGYVNESINEDGSSIHITSGKTESSFLPTIETKDISGLNKVGLPNLTGDQIVINSDRVVVSAKANEMIHFSKKRMSFTTDDEISFSANGKITVTTGESFSVNSQKIYLGRHNEKFQPMLLGTDTALWMDRLCDWMLTNVNSQIEVLTNLISFASGHKHIGNLKKPTNPILDAALPPTPINVAAWTKQLVSLKASQISLTLLKMKINSNLSGRVFGS
jgi:hypothetical protein